MYSYFNTFVLHIFNVEKKQFYVPYVHRFLKKSHNMNKHKKYSTGFLYSTPSFLSGFGSVMNLSGDYFDYSTSKSDNDADRKALRSDFNMIGQDISIALDEFKIKFLKKVETR